MVSRSMSYNVKPRYPRLPCFSVHLEVEHGNKATSASDHIPRDMFKNEAIMVCFLLLAIMLCVELCSFMAAWN